MGMVKFIRMSRSKAQSEEYFRERKKSRQHSGSMSHLHSSIKKLHAKGRGSGTKASEEMEGQVGGTEISAVGDDGGGQEALRGC